MSIGTALFLSGMFIGLVLLYSATKDRWKWRAVTKLAALAVFSISMFALAIGIAVFTWHSIPWPLDKQSEYSGVKLGMSKNEVLYLKGYPPRVLGESTNDPNWQGFQLVIDTAKFEKGKKVTDYNDWSYDLYQGTLTIMFDPNGSGVTAVQCFSNDKSGRCPAIASVVDGTSEVDLVRRLGPPETSRITGVTKAIRYETVGAYFHLEKERVYMLGINKQR